tara:strand:+ start:600 stop:767 length:168 start_codon:yes stop_codon:yes gene_type:complete
MGGKMIKNTIIIVLTFIILFSTDAMAEIAFFMEEHEVVALVSNGLEKLLDIMKGV